MDRVFDFSANFRRMLLVAASTLSPRLRSARRSGRNSCGERSAPARWPAARRDGASMYVDQRPRGIEDQHGRSDSAGSSYVAPRGYASTTSRRWRGRGSSALARPCKKNQVATRALAFTDATNSTRGPRQRRDEREAQVPLWDRGDVTDVTAIGEVITARNSYSLSRRRCRKPRQHCPRSSAATLPLASVSSTPATSATAESLLRESRRRDPRRGARGNKLMTQRCRYRRLRPRLPNSSSSSARPVAKHSSSAAATSNANTLVVGIPLRGSQIRYELIDAASGYGAVTPIETTSLPVRYEPCGDYLRRVQFAANAAAANTITVVANPLIPAAAPNPDQLVPAGEYLIDATCDANAVVFSTYRRRRQQRTASGARRSPAEIHRLPETPKSQYWCGIASSFRLMTRWRVPMQ